MSTDYKNTIFLPDTAFPMRGNLPEREPEILARWQKNNLNDSLQKAHADKEPFLLHDGPPYANGNIHIGHALNKILKDVVNKSYRMQGRHVNYVPGWDCHGLPIEWKIEEKYRKQKQDKDAVPILQFRQECRAFAQEWIDVQRDEFQRLGVDGDWHNPYTTMTNEAESQIFGEISKFLMNGGLYKGTKAVLWSVVEKTALAEAEVEYHDHTSMTVFVKFPVIKTNAKELENVSLVIWTTTPWTMPGNRAMAYGEEISYAVVDITEVTEKSLARVGDKLLLAVDLIDSVCKETGIANHTVLHTLKGVDLAGTVCAHPLRGQGYDFDVPLLPGEFVTTEQGTGIVHIAPGHGEDDFNLGRAHKIDIPQTVSEDGTYYKHVPLFAGLHVYKANQPVADAIAQAGGLLGQGKLVHSYPHSWRSKAPLIFRTTPQWFISMEQNDLRKNALAEIDKVAWFPPRGRNRIYAMVENRPDWCISRQRAWGVPIAVFTHKETGEVLRDQKIVDKIIAAFEKDGSDIWFEKDAAHWLAPDYDAELYEQSKDIVDVWFESGSTHAFVMEARDDLSSPSDLYLEGSDQHRGWFHSSLLESVGTRGMAPYKQVMTHGFILDEKGHKMSKSEGNTVAPQKVMDEYGADILRLWVVGSDYSADLRIGPEILKQHADTYRRLRNSLRYILGNLSGFTTAEKVEYDDMPDLEKYILHRLFEIDQQSRDYFANYDYLSFYNLIHQFCAVDLSAFYFDIRKDCFYCDHVDDPKRKAARTLLDHLFHYLVRWLAPVLAFTAEEAWLTRFPSDNDSIHLQTFLTAPKKWKNDELATQWEKLRDVRRVVTGALEIERREKRIGSSLQAAPVIYVPEKLDVDLAELCITSGFELRHTAAPGDAFRLEDVPDVAVVPALANGEKCDRCWKVLPSVGQQKDHPTLCDRCAGTVAQLAQAS